MICPQRKYLYPLLCLLLGSTLAKAQYTSEELEKGFQQRSKKVTDFVADEFTPPNIKIGDAEKYYFPKVIARLQKYGSSDSLANYYIHYFKDRSPFHFTLAGMARIMSMFRTAPEMKKTELTYLKNVWERGDSYNAWTAEGTENHINLSRTSGYLFAFYSKEYPQYRALAKDNMAKMKDWISHWSESLYENGTGEWNSSTYTLYNLNGWLNLYDFARDEQVRQMAKAVLDYYAAELALFYLDGGISGPEMRGHGVNYISESSWLAWLWFGGSKRDPSADRWKSSPIMSLMHPATSNYRPPEYCQKIAQKKDRYPTYYSLSRPDYLMDDRAFNKIHYYLEDDFSLGTVYTRYGGLSAGCTQIVPWKMVARSDNTRPYFVFGNGLYYNTQDKGRDPFTQYVQHKNVLIQMTRVPQNHDEIRKQANKILRRWNRRWYADFEVRFPTDGYRKDVVKGREQYTGKNRSFLALPKEAQTQRKGQTLFAQMGSTYAAVQVLGGRPPAGLQQPEGQDIEETHQYLFDQADYGNLCGFIVEFGSEKEQGSFQQFQNKIMESKGYNTEGYSEGLVRYTALNGDNIEARYNGNGSMREPLFDWGYGTTKQHVKITNPPYEQPDWPKGQGWGKVPSLSVNGNKVHLTSTFNIWTLSRRWPVCQGKKLKHYKSVLQMPADKPVYQVDYSGSVPEFSTGD